MIDHTAAATYAKVAAAKFPAYAQADERRIVSRLIGAALSAGYTVSLNDGGAWAVKRSADPAAIAVEVASTDEQTLCFRNAEGVVGSVFLVFGNDGDDVVCDHTDNDATHELVAWAQMHVIPLSQGWGFAGQTV
jgi:hypothetical protein